MITRKFADFIVSLKYDDIPSDVIEKAKLCFMDFLGVSLRGSKEKSGISALKSIQPFISHGKATIIGYGCGDPLNASLVNGIFAHSLDLDDGHRIAHLHPGASVIPAALALAEKEKVKGKEFLTSIIIGYEICLSLGIMINPHHRNMGFHSTGTCGTIGAAAASAKILDLNGEETLNCLGLAGTQAAGLLESDHKGSMGKHLHAGRAAQSGILSALLAREGFTGADTILEGDEGFLNVMSSGYDIKDGLGHFHIRQVYMKKYPVCRHIHSTLDSASKILNLLKLKSVDEAMVDEVIVRTYKVAAEHDNYKPENMEFLRQSLPVSLALFLLNGDLRLEHLKDFKFARELAKKIRIETDRKLDSLYPEKRPSKVILKLKDENLEALTVLPSGEPENPLTRGNILKKFKMLNSEYDVKKLKILNEMESTPMDELMDELDLGGNKP
ncbi:MmgE/PrpD family protein [Methanothermobacter sp. MT-2]|nr:MmgE/PrpD family protein [Methanothermobacter sp. MT-2]HHW05362.1 MmgE/PrpD family protein [Methanothermobacter sp.]HOK73117.1 MmgE/PrpD family protein [Methanothermobacter sp.]HPU36770.1 MmgE/PrpD family protein [Methanothermobacter sp.]